MEGLSAAASGIAVVSSAVQLAESLRKLHNFWDSIKEAPEDIRAISVDLELLSSVLTRIASEAQHARPDATFVAVLDGCWLKIKVLVGIVKEVEPGFGSRTSCTRKWTAFKAVLNQRRLVKFQEALDRLKATLLLLQQSHYSCLDRGWDLVVDQKLASIAQDISSLKLQSFPEATNRVANEVAAISSSCATFLEQEQSATTFGAGNSQFSSTNFPVSGKSQHRKTRPRRTLRKDKSITRFLLGTLQAESATKVQILPETCNDTSYNETLQQEHVQSFTIFPSAWLIRLGIRYGFRLNVRSSTRGWKNTLTTFRPVPDNALIFEFCKEGNTNAVRSLLSGGYASVKDTDSWGYTPLHFAAQNFHLDLCKILVDAGADISTPTFYADTPIVLASQRSLPYYTTYAVLSRIMEMYRLFTDSMNFQEEYGDGWTTLHNISSCWPELYGDTQAVAALLIWMLKLLNFELRTNVFERQFAILLNWFIGRHSFLQPACDLLLDYGGANIIKVAPFAVDGYTILHYRIVDDFAADVLCKILDKGADVHARGIDYDFTPHEESPASLAMSSAWRFINFRESLAVNGTDFDEFVSRELERNPTVHVGWEKDTLLSLFHYGYLSFRFCRPAWGCSDCQTAFGLTIQPHWRHFLERIKRGIEPDILHHADPRVDRVRTDDTSSAEKATSNSKSHACEPDINKHVALCERGPELETDEDDAHGYPSMISISSECIYALDEMVCWDCWLHYRKTGTRGPPEDEDVSSDIDATVGDDLSEDGYSPYLIHV